MSNVLTPKEFMSSRNHLGNSFIFMVRYALTRKTSADMATVSALRSNWNNIPCLHRDIILKELRSELELRTEEDDWLWDGFISDIDNGKLVHERYTVLVVASEKKPMTQSAGSCPPVVVVTDNETGNTRGVGYMRNAKANKDEAIRLLKELNK